MLCFAERKQAAPDETKFVATVRRQLLEAGAAREMQFAQDRGGAPHMRRIRGAPEFKTPIDQIPIQPRLDPERRFRVAHPFKAECDGAGRGKWNEMTGDDHARVSIGTAGMILGSAIDNSDAEAPLRCIVRGTKADNTCTDDNDFFHYARSPQQSGSDGFSRSRASLFTYAVPVMVGIILPSTSSTVPSKMLPVMLSWRHVVPGANFPSAKRHAIFALVPVPQGERSYALPGQRTKLRESAFSDFENNST